MWLSIQIYVNPDNFSKIIALAETNNLHIHAKPRFKHSVPSLVPLAQDVRVHPVMIESHNSNG